MTRSELLGDISVSATRPVRRASRATNEQKQPMRDKLFKVLEAVAVKGERCPQMSELRDVHKINRSHATPVDLAMDGRIRVEIYSRNWRVVEIREGPNTGKRTEKPPRRGKPYKVYGTSHHSTASTGE